MLNASPLLTTTTVTLPCDHCGYSHSGYSQAGRASAYTHALVLLDNCKERRAWLARQTARSTRNVHQQ